MLGTKQDRLTSTTRLSGGEILLINLPVIGFLCLALLVLGLAIPVGGKLRILLMLMAWWSLSGSIMLLYDYKNKHRKYLRLIRFPQLSPAITRSLKDTLCGLCLYLSYLYRKGRENKTSE